MYTILMIARDRRSVTIGLCPEGLGWYFQTAVDQIDVFIFPEATATSLAKAIKVALLGERAYLDYLSVQMVLSNGSKEAQFHLSLSPLCRLKTEEVIEISLDWGEVLPSGYFRRYASIRFLPEELTLLAEGINGFYAPVPQITKLADLIELNS